MYLTPQPTQYEAGGQYYVKDQAVILLARANFAGNFLPSDFSATALVRTVKEEPFGNFSARTATVANRRVSAVNRYFNVPEEIYQLGIPVPRPITDAYEQGNEEPLFNWARANIKLLKEPVVIGRPRRADTTSPLSPVYIRRYPQVTKELCDTCRQEHPTYRNINLYEGGIATTAYCWWCGARSKHTGRVVERYELKNIFRYAGNGINYCDAHIWMNLGEPSDYQPHSSNHCQACDAMRDNPLHDLSVFGTWPGGSRPLGGVL